MLGKPWQNVKFKHCWIDSCRDRMHKHTDYRASPGQGHMALVLPWPLQQRTCNSFDCRGARTTFFLLSLLSALLHCLSKIPPSSQACYRVSLNRLHFQSTPLACSSSLPLHPTRSVLEPCLSCSCLLACSLCQAGLRDRTGNTWLPNLTTEPKVCSLTLTVSGPCLVSCSWQLHMVFLSQGELPLQIWGGSDHQTESSNRPVYLCCDYHVRWWLVLVSLFSAYLLATVSSPGIQ